MTAEQLHARTVVSEDFRILGVRLLPLTLGHVAVLNHLGCINPTNPGELGLAVFVCSMRHDKVMMKLRSSLFPMRMWFWQRRLGVWDFREKLAMFQEYLAHHMEMPEVISKGEVGECFIPAAQCYRVILLSRLGYSPKDVDFAPYLQAKWDFITLQELEGKADVMDFTGSDLDEIQAGIDVEAVTAAAMKLFGQTTAEN